MATDAGRWYQDRLSWRETGTVLAALAAMLLLAALLVHGSCTHPGPPVSRPVSGTPRAGWCSAVHGATPWPLLVLAPTGIAALAFALLGRRTVFCVVLGLLIAVGAFVNEAVGDGLEFASTI